MTEAFDGPEPGTENEADQRHREEWEARMGLAAMRLTRSDDLSAYQALINGLTVTRRRLRPEILRAIGEDPRTGPAIAMTPELALMIEANTEPEPSPQQVRDAKAANRATEERERASSNGAAPEHNGARFLTALEFLELEDEHAPAMLGTEADTVLTMGGFLLMAGEGGASKTTLTIDALAHLCSGTPWLGIPVPAPVKALIIENEGTRPKFRQKLAEKAASWEGAPWLPNLHVYANPWGQFTFADPLERSELRTFLAEHGIHLVMADPVDSLGVQGVGSPDETRMFMAWLREVGLYDSGYPVSYWLLHHVGKGQHATLLQRLSGDWGKHPDSVLMVSPEGPKATRIQWAKTRWATTGGPDWLPAEAQHLEWVVEARGFKLQERPAGATPEELLDRIFAYLGEHPGSSGGAIYKSVKGEDKRLREVLQTALTEGHVENRGTERRPQYHLTGSGSQTALEEPPGEPADEAAAEEDFPW